MSEPILPNASGIDSEMAGQLAALSARLTEIEKKNFEPSTAEGVSDKSMLDELDFLTNRISELARYVAFGLTALFFVLLSSSSDFAKEIMESHGPLILLISFFGCLALLADYAQYQFGKIYVKRVLDQARRGGPRQYDEEHPLYRSRKWSSWFKQMLAGVGAIILAGLLVYVYFSGELATAQNCFEQKKPLPTAFAIRTTGSHKRKC
jgi:hypothetical protein